MYGSLYIEQTLSLTFGLFPTYGYPAVPGSYPPWHSDQTLLRVPTGLQPTDGAAVTPPCCIHGRETKRLKAGEKLGTPIKWSPLAAVTHYLLQVCLNRNFVGPTLQTIKVDAPTAEYYPVFGQDVRYGDKVYWRVRGFTATGLKTPQSRIQSFKISDGVNSSCCQRFDVHVKISGVDRAMCCDKQMFHNETTFTSKNADGTRVCEHVRSVWSLVQNPNDTGNSLDPNPGAHNKKLCIVNIACKKSQTFTLRLTQTFRETATGCLFTCQMDKQVVVDCHTGYPAYKPWLQTDFGRFKNPYTGQPLLSSIFLPLLADQSGSAYYGGMQGLVDTMRGLINSGSYALMSLPLPGWSIAVAPVVTVGEESLSEARPQDHCKQDPGPARGVKMEVRVPIPPSSGDVFDYATATSSADTSVTDVPTTVTHDTTVRAVAPFSFVDNALCINEADDLEIGWSATFSGDSYEGSVLVWLEHSTDGGSSWATVEGSQRDWPTFNGRANSYSMAMVLTATDNSRYRVRAQAHGGASSCTIQGNGGNANSGPLLWAHQF